MNGQLFGYQCSYWNYHEKKHLPERWVCYDHLGSDLVQICKGNRIFNNMTGQTILYMLRENGQVDYSFIFGCEILGRLTDHVLIEFIEGGIWLSDGFILTSDGNLIELLYKQSQKLNQKLVQKGWSQNVCENVEDPPVSFKVSLPKFSDKPKETHFEIIFQSGRTIFFSKIFD